MSSVLGVLASFVDVHRANELQVDSSQLLSVSALNLMMNFIADDAKSTPQSHNHDSSY